MKNILIMLASISLYCLSTAPALTGDGLLGESIEVKIWQGGDKNCFFNEEKIKRIAEKYIERVCNKEVSKVKSTSRIYIKIGWSYIDNVNKITGSVVSTSRNECAGAMVTDSQYIVKKKLIKDDGIDGNSDVSVRNDQIMTVLFYQRSSSASINYAFNGIEEAMKENMYELCN